MERLLLAVMVLVAPVAALAAPGDYQPYTPPEGGQVSAPLFVLIAYAAIWIVLLGFLASVWRRQRRVEEELAAIEKRLGPS